MKILELRSLRMVEAMGLGIDDELLYELRGVVDVKNGVVRVVDPIGLAMIIIKLGVDVEAVSRLLGWRDFEKLCVEALRSHGFEVKAPLRFKYEDRRYEVDIAAFKRQVMLVIDCKHWMMRGGQSSKIRRASVKHLDKCVKLARLRKTGFTIPLIVTLMDLGFKQPVEGVLIVPIFKLNSFLLGFESHIDELPALG
jgi:hypothetical protein